MTYAELVLAFRQLANDNVAPYLWGDTEVAMFLNDAEKEACTRAHLLIEEDNATYCTIPIVSGTPTYTLHANVLDVFTAKIGAVKLTRITREDLDRDVPSWESATGDPKYYYIASGKIRIVPEPDASGSLTMVVSRLPITMAITGPEIHARYHMRLIDWCMRLAHLKRDADLGSEEIAEKYAARFAASFGEYVDEGVHKQYMMKRTPAVKQVKLTL